MNILVISAHPDDETLGCGGTLLRHVAMGDSLYWLIATVAREPKWSETVIAAKVKEVDSVAAAYGMRKVHKLGFPATELDFVPRDELIKGIHDVVCEVRPELIYMIHGGDVHDDHRIVFEAVMSVIKPWRMRELGVRKALSYETLSSTEAAPADIKNVFIPNVFNDISAYIERKLEVMSLYKTEFQSDPLPRSFSAIRALAGYRGATIGVEYAESFALIRELI